MNLETIDAAANRLGVSQSTIRNWMTEIIDRERSFERQYYSAELNKLLANVNEKFQGLEYRIAKLESTPVSVVKFNSKNSWWKLW